MTIDEITEELNEIVRFKEQGELVDAVGRASRLLRLARYQQAGDPHGLLAKDIRLAIRRLPPDTRRLARGWLHIDLAGGPITARERLLKVNKYSPTAVGWLRKAVLGRVAVELLKIYEGEQCSYEMRAVDITVSDCIFAQALGRREHGRQISFRWTIESLVTDMRLFAFKQKVPGALEFIRLEPDKCGLEYQVAERLAADGPDTHWYILLLKQPLPIGTPVTLTATMVFHKAAKADPQFDYIPEMPIGKLTLALNPLWDTTPCECKAVDIVGGKTLKVYKGKPEVEHLPFDDVSYTRFTIRPPVVGRCYSLLWEQEYL